MKLNADKIPIETCHKQNSEALCTKENQAPDLLFHLGYGEPANLNLREPWHSIECDILQRLLNLSSIAALRCGYAPVGYTSLSTRRMSMRLLHATCLKLLARACIQDKRRGWTLGMCNLSAIVVRQRFGAMANLCRVDEMKNQLKAEEIVDGCTLLGQDKATEKTWWIWTVTTSYFPPAVTS